jgi:hypothetical protein
MQPGQAAFGGRTMELDENLKQLMKELGAAINESLSDSESIADAISNIKGAGYDVFLVLEATIGFNRHDDANGDSDTEQAGDAELRPVRMETLELTNQDAKFLRSLKISVDEDNPSEK